MSSETDIDLDQTILYHQLDTYPWATDAEFQGGLRAILGSVQDPAQVDHLTLRAKCYYYARKAGKVVDFEGYKRWVESLGEDRDLNAVENWMGGPVLHGGVEEGEEDDEVGANSPEDVAEVAAAAAGGIGGTAVNEAPKPASFAEICDMIAEGKPIPGIKEIPDTVLEGQASESMASKRRKPWEKKSEGEGERVEAQPSWMNTAT